jgi:cyclic pyranopterin phosphate synthase
MTETPTEPPPLFDVPEEAEASAPPAALSAAPQWEAPPVAAVPEVLDLPLLTEALEPADGPPSSGGVAQGGMPRAPESSSVSAAVEPPAAPESSDTPSLTHVRADGSAHMVDVGGKATTKRRAVAQAVLVTRDDVVAAVLSGGLPKGEAIGTARIAGIMAAKQTSSLIPLCHPLPITSITVDITGERDRLTVVATVATTGVTGVEMEALTAASVAALTLYDMIKAVDKVAVITDIRVREKQGGKSGDWTAS